MSDHTLTVNVNLPGLLPILKTFLFNQGTIMADLTALNAKVDELVASNAALSDKVTESNGKQDALLLVASQTKDALVALQGQTNPDFQPIIDKLDGAIQANANTTQNIVLEEAKVDAGTAADGPT